MQRIVIAVAAVMTLAVMAVAPAAQAGGLAAGLAVASVGHAADEAAKNPEPAAAQTVSSEGKAVEKVTEVVVNLVIVKVAEKVITETIGAVGDILRCDIGAGEKSLWRAIGLPRIKC
jgi:hypothetical protein